MPPLKVYADFHNLDDSNRLRLDCAGTVADLTRLGIGLREGLVLTFCMDDAEDQGQADELLAEGIVQYDEAERSWVALIDWSAVRHASEEPLAAPLSEAASGRLDVGQQLQSDRFFTVQQQQRLAELMVRWRAARDGQATLAPEEQAELEALVAAEVRASADRAAALVRGLTP